MFTIERQHNIMNELRKEKSITVTNLSKKFFIGEATIRRDLEKLEKAGFLKRTYGGAVLLDGLDMEIPLTVRETENREEKSIIAQLAGKFVSNGDIIIIDSSSTTLKIVPCLKNKENLTVITNSAKASLELGEQHHARVYCTGGMLRENSQSFIGQQARSFIESYSADILFFSCRGLSMEKGLTDSNEEEVELRKIMIKNSNESILLCDHTKFDQISFCKIGNFDCINTIITDRMPSQCWIQFLEEKGVKLVYNKN